MKFTLAIAALVASTSAVGTWWTNTPQTSLVALKVSEGMNLEKILKEIDTDNSGDLDLKEVNAAIAAFAKEEGFELPAGWKKESEAIFNHVDANGNGKVTLDEIKAAIFNAVDADKDGKWSLKEVTQAIGGMAKEHGVQLKKGW
jgi:Ca2+-binding EF-hand superfamily protein|tara:strand:+ start:262 stop:693 length:432 start_codon:yes stop_codon:yes gene_type:complete